MTVLNTENTITPSNTQEKSKIKDDNEIDIQEEDPNWKAFREIRKLGNSHRKKFDIRNKESA
jgi:hypothetical protein